MTPNPPSPEPMTIEQKQIAEFWTYVENAWDIETRAEIEALAKKMGCGPLFLAAHHTWKRNPQVATLLAEIDSLKVALTAHEAERVKNERDYCQLREVADEAIVEAARLRAELEEARKPR